MDSEKKRVAITSSATYLSRGIERYFRTLAVESRSGAYEKSSSSHVACDAAANRTPSRRQMQNRGKLALSHASPSCRDQSHKVRYYAGLAAVAAARSFPGTPYVPEWILAYP